MSFAFHINTWNNKSKEQLALTELSVPGPIKVLLSRFLCYAEIDLLREAKTSHVSYLKGWMPALSQIYL